MPDKPAAAEESAGIVLVGNPNVGKSVIFGWLTGEYVIVSNYPGTTVEITRGTTKVGGRHRLVADTPGVNSLIPMSEDERVTRDILLEGDRLQVIQVCDAKNLRRGLLITLQLAEMEKPVVLILNMADEARERGILVDHDRLAGILGVPVFSTVATRRKGLDGLGKGLEERRQCRLRPRYGAALEEAIARIEELLPENQAGKRALAVMLLSGDESLQTWVQTHLGEEAIQGIESVHRGLQEQYSEPLGFLINRMRLREVDAVLEEIFHRAGGGEERGLASRLSRWTLHPVGGMPILLIVLYAIYKFVGSFGAGTAVDFLQNVVFGRGVNPAATRLVDLLGPGVFLRDLLVGPYGLITMGLTYALAIVLPIVGTFFLAFGLLEDSGYLPRLAVMVNRVFKKIGLNGKAVLPMVLGLGCDTMATLTTRVLETKKERILVTFLLALGIPCSAQIGVMAGMFSMISAKAVLLWGLVILASMGVVGLLADKVIPGEKTDFILEIPPLRIPTWSNIIIKTLARVEWFLKEAVPLFLLGTLLLFLSDRLGLLQAVQRAAEPLVVHFLGLPPKTTEVFLLGFLRRDYGAAGLFLMARNHELDPVQIVVSLVTITLFLPCLAHFLMIVKERGLGQAVAMSAFIFPFAFLVGGGLHFLLRFLGVAL